MNSISIDNKLKNKNNQNFFILFFILTFNSITQQRTIEYFGLNSKAKEI